MSDERVRYELRDDVALLHWDDGKANVVSPAAQADLNAALDRAEKEAKAVVICGRAGRFSAGFDLGIMNAGDARAIAAMVRGGGELGLRLFSFPLPTVAAVHGHALAMGAVLLMAIDERIAADVPAKVGLNETAIGMTLPGFALILARERLAPTHLVRAVANAELYSPADAVEAGFIDQVVPADELLGVALARAKTLAQLDTRAHHATKLALRGPVIEALRASLQQVE